MLQIIDKIGVVHRITDKGDVRVQYDTFPSRWTLHPAALSKVSDFSVGDHVRIHSDIEKVRELQKRHGEWVDLMNTVS